MDVPFLDIVAEIIIYMLKYLNNQSEKLRNTLQYNGFTQTNTHI